MEVGSFDAQDDEIDHCHIKRMESIPGNYLSFTLLDHVHVARSHQDERAPALRWSYPQHLAEGDWVVGTTHYNPRTPVVGEYSQFISSHLDSSHLRSHLGPLTSVHLTSVHLTLVHLNSVHLILVQLASVPLI